MQVNLASEMTVLANELHRLSSAHLPTRDFSLRGIRDAIEEVFAYFPVYRTYVTAADGASAQDRRYIEWATARAKKASPAADTSVFDFLRDAADRRSRGQCRLPAGGGFPGRHARPADQRAGDGEGAGGHRLLPLRPPHLAQRGRRRPRRFGVSRAAFHHTNQARARKTGRSTCSRARRTTPSAARTLARASICSREIPDEWARRVVQLAAPQSRRADRVNGDGPTPHPQ